MNALDKSYAPVFYDDAGHGFMRRGEETDAPEADATAMRKSWERWLDLISER